MQINTFFAKTKDFFTKKKIIWTIVIVAVLFGIWYVSFGRKTPGSGIQIGKVTQQDLRKTVLTTGQVVSSTDLGLSFQASGVVRRINVKEGSRVGAGQVLASLDQNVALANLESARATYNKVVASATKQDIAVSQANVDAAVTTLLNAQENLRRGLTTAYSNAYATIISSTNILFSNPQSTSPQFGILGTVQTNQQLVSNVNLGRVIMNENIVLWQKEMGTVSLENQNQVAQSIVARLSTVSDFLTDILTLLTSYTQVTSSGSQTTVTAYQTTVSTAKTTIDTLSTTITTYVQAVRSAESALAQAKATLSLKQAPARTEDLSIAESQVLAAQSALENTIIRAPAGGTVTEVGVKLGEQATAMKVVFKIQDVNQLYAEALVSEADIASVKVGQTIDNTFDALGPDQVFKSTVLTVNPASTVISGVVNYKVTSNLENISDIKPGMTANMTVLVAEKKNVLAVPSSSIVNQKGKRFVKVVTDPKTKTFNLVEVVTGLEADAGLTEIVSGLTVGQDVVTYIKK